MALVTHSYSYANYEKDEERKFLITETKHHETGLSSSFEYSEVLADVSMKLEPEGNARVPEPSRARKVVTMLACLFLHMGSLGMVVALGVIYVELIAYFDAPRSEAALVQSMYVGVSLGGGLLFTKLVTKYDTGLVIAGASLVATISFCTSALAPSIQVVIMLIGAITGLLCSINVLGAFVVVSWMFPKNRKFALAILTTGATMGQTVLPYVATTLVDRYFWTGAVIILGGFLYLNCIPCGLLIHSSKPYFQKGDVKKMKQSKLLDLSCFSDAAFMVYLSTCFTFFATGPVEQWFVVDMSVLKGFTVDDGATLLSLNGVFSFTGRCIGTLILRILPNTRQELHIAYAFFTWGIGHIIVSQSPVYWGMVLGIVVRGLSSGLVVAFLPGLQIDVRGLEKYPETVSMANFLNGAGSIIGGFLGGLSFDLTKSYDLIFFIASGVNIYNALTMLIIFFIFTYRRDKHVYEKL